VGVDISLAGGWIEVASIVHWPGEVVVSMRPVSMFATGPGSEIEQLRTELQGRWRQAARAVMVLLSLRGLPPSRIAVQLDCHPATVRRWIGRFNGEGLADRPRPGRPRLGGRQLTSRIATLLERPGPWTLPRIRRYLGWPQVRMHTMYRRVRLVAIWRRPKLTGRGDPDHDHVVAGIVARLLDLPAARWSWPRTRRTCTCCRMCGPAGRCADGARGPHPGHEPQGRRAGGGRGEHREVGLPAGPPLRGGPHRPAGPGAPGVPAGPGDRGDLR
jgi:transposase